MRPVVDEIQREQALDVGRSFIVQAPAGSGKTELLIRRLLALLATVEQPETVLAITFTRKAAAEMRHRLLEALAQSEGPAPSGTSLRTWQLARQVALRDQSQGWNLRRNPARLQIQTIDSFNAALVRRMPWLARLGAMPEITDDPTALYRQAAENLLLRLERGQAGAEGLAILLAHLDNRLDRLRDLLAQLLLRRDHWLRHLLRDGASRQRQLLEEAAARLAEAELRDLAGRIPPSLAEEIVELAAYAGSHLDEADGAPLLRDLRRLPPPERSAMPIWQGLARLLVTADGKGFRRRVDTRNGFPADQGEVGKQMKQRLADLGATLSDIDGLAAGLHRLHQWQHCGYSDDQWQVLAALLELLPLAVQELWRVFRAETQADFAEIALRALGALQLDDGPSDLLLRLDAGLQHILVDEFQDTSHLQFALLQRLTEGWQPGDGRTLFLVGDPMQSIYRFREAEVGLFLRAWRDGIGTVPLQPLQLASNFRSQQGIVDWLNDSFARLFPQREDPFRGAVAYVPCQAVHPPLSEPAVRLLPQTARDDAEEAQQLVAEVRRTLALHPDDSLAVLVRARPHLQEISAALRQAGIPFRAQEIDPLQDRPAVLDAVALTRALLHPGDRLAWLTVLRAPWCGLTLADLHALCGTWPYRTLPELAVDAAVVAGLSDNGRQRLQRVLPLLQRGREARGRLALRRLVEGCWLALAGPACYGPAEREDVAQLFDLLERCDVGGEPLSLSALEQGLRRLYAVPEAAGARLQLMTVHKAKGLQFDHVFLPGLGRTVRGGDPSLLRWLETVDGELLLAPIPPVGGDGGPNPVYQAIGRVEEDRERHETVRLLYVAATRAVRHLHLFGHAATDAAGNSKPSPGSFLEALWPVVETRCREAAAPVPAGRMAPAPPLLCRLPAGYAQPPLAPVALPSGLIVARSATATPGKAQPRLDLFTGYEAETARHIGTLVHRWLERIARDGLEVWPTGRLEQMLPVFRHQLIALGVIGAESEDAAQICFASLHNALTSERGRWLLSRRENGAAELALSGMLRGELVHAVIDRTFVDVGVRWVVDYKTGAPREGGLNAFLQAEAAKYRSQLAVYARLFAAMNPGVVVRCGLYFPRCDGWIEFPPDTTEI